MCFSILCVRDSLLQIVMFYFYFVEHFLGSDKFVRKAWKTKETRDRHWGGLATVAPSGEELVQVKQAGGKRKWEREVRGERYEAEATRRLGLGVDFTKVDRFEGLRGGTSMLYELMSLEVSLA